jgi:hypothetical protein
VWESVRLKLRQREKVGEVGWSPSVQCQREEVSSPDSPNTMRTADSE